MLTANKNLTAIYSACGPPALGAIQSIKNAGIKCGGIILVGYDAGADEQKAIKQGCETASVAQHPDKIGFLGIATLYAAVQGKKVPTKVDTGTNLCHERPTRSSTGWWVSRRSSSPRDPLRSMVVDAHHHFWNPARIPQPWMTDEHTAIARTFEPPDLEPLLADCGVGRTVLVQSAASDEDTDYMFEVAGAVEWVGAIVGWCQLDDPGCCTASTRRATGTREAPGHPAPHPPGAGPHWILDQRSRPVSACSRTVGSCSSSPAVYPDHLDDIPTIAARHAG
jgi:hypothetical protein